MFFLNWLVYYLSIFIGIADKEQRVIYYMDASDRTSLKESADCINRDVTKPSVKYENVYGFIQGCLISCCKCVVDFE